MWSNGWDKPNKQINKSFAKMGQRTVNSFFIGNGNNFDFVTLSKMCTYVSVSVSLLVTKRNFHAKTKPKSCFALIAVKYKRPTGVSKEWQRLEKACLVYY